MTTIVAGRRFRVPSSAAVGLLAGLVVTLLAGFIPLSIAARQLTLNDAWAASTMVIVIACAGVGVVVAGHQPHNPIGWLLLGVAACLGLSIDSGLYAVADYRLRHGTLPLGPAVLLFSPLWAVAVAAFGLVVLLFPDGRLASRRWRWVVHAYLAIGACWLLSIYAVTVRAIAGHHIHIMPNGDLSVIDHPSGNAAWLPWAEAVILPLLVVFWLAFLGRLVPGWRNAGGERRQQLKWLMSGTVVCIAAGGTEVLSGTLNPDIPAVEQVMINVLGFGVAALPVSIGIGILKYRLYEIDRIISRTLVYAIVTGLLVGVYAGLVLLITQVFRVHTPVAVAASTLAAAALFNPLRRRVQQMVDRRFNRGRYDADQTVATFAARLKDAVDLDAVRDDLAHAVQQTLEPAHISVWISAAHRQTRPGAASPTPLLLDQHQAKPPSPAC